METEKLIKWVKFRLTRDKDEQVKVEIIERLKKYSEVEPWLKKIWDKLESLSVRDK